MQNDKDNIRMKYRSSHMVQNIEQISANSWTSKIIRSCCR